MTKLTALIRVALAASCVLCALCPPGAALARDEVADEMDAYMSALVAAEDFSGSVLVAWDGVPVLSRGYGLADREHGVPCTAETKYRLGSVTKQFTAAAVLLLQEAGKLAVTDGVRLHVEDAPEAWSGITVHHLLCHQSGIWNLTRDLSMPTWWMIPSRPRETMRRFVDRPLEFEPGTGFSYSNSGYVVLGVIVEEVSGGTWERFLRESVFDPLGMDDSGHDTYAAILPHRAEGYTRDAAGQVERAPYHDMDLPIGGGDLYSTVEDLLRWDQALYGDELLSGASREAMFRPNRSGYAYGWMVGATNGRPTTSHGGGINGFVTRILRFTADRSTVIVLCNNTWSDPGRVSDDLAAILYGEEYVLPEAGEEG